MTKKDIETARERMKQVHEDPDEHIGSSFDDFLKEEGIYWRVKISTKWRAFKRWLRKVI